jgi:hypothetical protein
MTMTQNEVINRLSLELAVKVGDFDNLNTYRWFIRQALVIGTDHFTRDMEEIVQMDQFGKEIDRFKGVTDCSRKTGIRQGDISAVLTGIQHSAGGFLFIKAKDKELIPIKKTA